MNEKKIISVQILPVEKCYTFFQDKEDCFFVKFIRFTTYDDGSTAYHPIIEHHFLIETEYSYNGNCIDAKDSFYSLYFDSISAAGFNELVDKFIKANPSWGKDRCLNFWKNEFKSRGIVIEEYI